MTSTPGFVVLLPVKQLAHAKTRLGAHEVPRSDLASAFALDTITACVASDLVEQVLVVTDDVAFATRARKLGCAVIPDGVSGDLNASLVQAALEAQRRWPALQPVALCADLPALQAPDLSAGLAALSGHPRGFVRDADGTGTVAYSAVRAELFAPCFGADSAAAHLASGAAEAQGALPSLRRDVDSPETLAEAQLLGLGTHSAALLAH